MTDLWWHALKNYINVTDPKFFSVSVDFGDISFPELSQRLIAGIILWVL